MKPPATRTTAPPERLPFNEWAKYIRQQADKNRNIHKPQ